MEQMGVSIQLQTVTRCLTCRNWSGRFSRWKTLAVDSRGEARTVREEGRVDHRETKHNAGQQNGSGVMMQLFIETYGTHTITFDVVPRVLFGCEWKVQKHRDVGM